MDAVSTFGDVEDPWDIQCRKPPYGCESIQSLPNDLHNLRGQSAMPKT
jgi:hypothetical protein